MDVNNRESAADVSDPSSGSATAASMKRTLADKATEAKDALDEFGRKAANKLDATRESAAHAMHRTANTVDSGTDQFSEYGHIAADRLHATADYVLETDFDSIVRDVQGLIKRYPVQALAVAAIAGFLAGRGLRR
jgi:ElaB/YqjD/DUF883 family membrane-anchored ribosome-binding protein